MSKLRMDFHKTTQFFKAHYHAHHLFDEIPNRSHVSYSNSNAFKLLSRQNSFTEILNLYTRFLQFGSTPDHLALPSVVRACAAIPNHFFGRCVHCHIIRLGYSDDLFILNGLIAMYSKCHDIVGARSIFNELKNRNLISWTSMISGYVQNEMPLEALRIFSTMRSSVLDIDPDFVLLVSVIKAYTDLEDLSHGQSVHGLVIKFGFEDEQDLLIALTAMYAKCRQVHIARSLFNKVPSSDVLLWNAMISGYAKANGYASEAVSLFQELIKRNLVPDSITIRTAILACAQVGSLKVGRWIEDYVSRSKFKDDIFVNTALIDMYAKCGTMGHARERFNLIAERDVVVWSAMIAGYGLHGQAEEAICLFDEMISAGLKPNDVTFLSLLSTCNHAGLVEEGRMYFQSMKDHGIEPRHQHYACMVDLLARAGHLVEAYEFIKGMPMKPEVSVWGALLTACNMYGHVELGECAAKHVFAIDSNNAGHYVQLSNIYASADMWNDAAKVRFKMRGKGVTKPIGCSFMEINGKLHSFHAWEKTHPRPNEVYAMLEELENKLKEAGFVSHDDAVIFKAEEENDGSLCDHSVRLAIAFGMISTVPGTTLRITKSLRTCLRCHSATKYISKIIEREIIVRDANCYHHFKYGLCSCRDCW